MRIDALPTTMLHWQVDTAAERPILDHARSLDRFLADIEKRAFRIARIAVRDDDDALDIVQDSMLQLARRYGQRPSAQWRPLFYRILQNRIRDCQRRRKARSKLFAWWPWQADDEERNDVSAVAPDDAQPTAIERIMTDEALQLLERALQELPGRQQQAFLLRVFEGLDVTDTAAAMGCSTGSVKTHYSRAVHCLREKLGEAW